jgi:hypothetical protein
LFVSIPFPPVSSKPTFPHTLSLFCRNDMGTTANNRANQFLHETLMFLPDSAHYLWFSKPFPPSKDFWHPLRAPFCPLTSQTAIKGIKFNKTFDYWRWEWARASAIVNWGQYRRKNKRKRE